MRSDQTLIKVGGFSLVTVTEGDEHGANCPGYEMRNKPETNSVLQPHGHPLLHITNDSHQLNWIVSVVCCYHCDIFYKGLSMEFNSLMGNKFN